MQSKPQNPPNRHHFIPEFLLKQWAGPDGEFWRYFRQGPDRVDCKPAAPGAVCYRRGLYATGYIPAEHKQQVETLFMAPLDTKAAEAHALLLEGAIARLSDEQRSRWAGFMMSIWFRTPHDVAGMRDIAAALFDAGAVTRALGLDEEVEFPPGTADQFAMDLMMNSIDDKGRGEELINMHWDVIGVRNRREFFISDWPMDQPVSVPRLGAGSSYVALPIAPNRLFAASHSRTLIAALRDMPERELITRQNRASVTQADEFVGATNRNAEQFIRDNFGTLDRPSLIAGLAEKYRAMAAPD
jgi:hypothetical protein